MHMRRYRRGRDTDRPASETPSGPAGGVVFDCDGVLADTTHCWDEAFAGTAREFGLTLTDEQLRELRGAALATAAERIAGWLDRPIRTRAVVGELSYRLERSIDGSELQLTDGIAELLRDLHGTVRLGVASNSPRSVLLRVLARLRITEYFAAVIGADDVERPKPAPDPYWAACEALSIDPRRSLAIEDSDVGVRSAIAAGLAVVEVVGRPSPSGSQAPLRDGALRVTSLGDDRIRRLVLGSVVVPLPREGR